MTFEGIEVAVAMKKVMALNDAERSDDRIDGTPRSNASCSECAMVACSSSCYIATAHRAKFEQRECSRHALKISFGREASQHFRHDKVAYKYLCFKYSVESVGLIGNAPVEIVDPDRRVDHRHLRGLRSRRIAFRSPSQWTLPRKDRMAFSCSAKRTISSRLRSTVSRLVVAPDTRIARFINWSSITMLVRMRYHLMCILGHLATHLNRQLPNAEM